MFKWLFAEFIEPEDTFNAEDARNIMLAHRHKEASLSVVLRNIKKRAAVGSGYILVPEMEKDTINELKDRKFKVEQHSETGEYRHIVSWESNNG